MKVRSGFVSNSSSSSFIICCKEDTKKVELLKKLKSHLLKDVGDQPNQFTSLNEKIIDVIIDRIEKDLTPYDPDGWYSPITNDLPDELKQVIVDNQLTKTLGVSFRSWGNGAEDEIENLICDYLQIQGQGEDFVFFKNNSY